MNGITIYEFDALMATGSDAEDAEGLHRIPDKVYTWLEDQCLRSAEVGEATWLRLTQRHGRRVVQVTSYVGVIRAPNGFQIEVLPKVGKAIGGGVSEARRLLIEMLCGLKGFRHIQTDSAMVAAKRMPLLEVFITEFLRTVDNIVRRGLRSDYSRREGNLFALRGKLLMAPHLRQNLQRADRFFTEYDEFSIDRPENRLLHAALWRTITLATSRTNQQLARELQFVFTSVPASQQPNEDFKFVRLDRSMGNYADALAWSRIILNGDSPITGSGTIRAPSLLFAMEALFEAFVAKHLAAQLSRPLRLRVQTQTHYLVCHREQNWFQLRPDFLVQDSNRNILILDAKWKLLDSGLANSAGKYGLAQSDFYQLLAYGQSFLEGAGDVVLIFPRTDAFRLPLDVFEFPKCANLRLWVLPFCLATRRLILPSSSPATFAAVCS